MGASGRAIKHQSGTHGRKSQPGKKKRFAKKVAQKRELEAQQLEALQKEWDCMGKNAQDFYGDFETFINGKKW